MVFFLYGYVEKILYAETKIILRRCTQNIYPEYMISKTKRPFENFPNIFR